MLRLKCFYCRIQNKYKLRRLLKKGKSSSAEAKDAQRDGLMKIGLRLFMLQLLKHSKLRAKDR